MFRDVRREIVMATTPVEVKKTPPAPANPPDAVKQLFLVSDGVSHKLITIPR
jgi:hypothetical protein